MSGSISAVAPGLPRRQFIAATIALAVASLSYGLTVPLLSLILDHQGVDPTLIGFNTGAYFIAIFAVAPFTARLMRLYDPARLMLISILVMAVLIVLLRVFPNVWLWFPLRFGIGATAGFLWIVGEAWINHTADPARRGRIIAIYGIVVSAGYGLGPMILSLTGTDGWPPFLATTVLLLVGAAALATAFGLAQRLEGTPPAPLAYYMRIAPVAMFGYFTFGAVDTALLTFLPIYAMELGLDVVNVIQLITVLAIGGMTLQYPLGWLADHVDNYAIAIAAAIALLLGSVALPWFLPHAVINVLFMFFYGGLLGALYTIPLVLLGRQFKGADLSAASAMLNIMFSMGALIWPSLGGVIMDQFGERAMPALLVAAYVVFLSVALTAWWRCSAVSRSTTEMVRNHEGDS